MREFIHVVVAALLMQAGSASLLPQKSAAPKHLTLAATASAPAAAPGARISLSVDVTPDPGIHVYAPGAVDFLPIAMTIDPPAGAALGTVQYPKSEMFSFAGDEVPVFQKPFRLTQDVTLPSSAKRGTTMTISGMVRYQACDNAVCFIPTSAPVTWTVAVK